MIRYRTEMSFESPRNALDVMRFEIGEMKNTDILEYVRDNYDLPRMLKDNIDEMIGTLDDIDENDDELGHLLKEILFCIADETGVDVRYALWLADRDSVIENYEGDELEIHAYETDGAVVLSDLGYDGTLYGYASMPEEIEEEDVMESFTVLSGGKLSTVTAVSLD